jgi:hypothetical protein
MIEQLTNRSHGEQIDTAPATGVFSPSSPRYLTCTKMWNKYVLFVSCSEINLCTVKILIGWGRNWNNDHEHHGIQYIHNIKKYKINYNSDHDYQMTDHQ